MGDGGDGGDAVDYSAAEIPVDFGTEVVKAAAADPGDDFDDLIVADTGGVPAKDREEDDLVEITWVEPDTTSGT
jgi:hypothetical protein